MKEVIAIMGRPVPYTRMTRKGKYVNKAAKKYLAYKNLVGVTARNLGIDIKKRKSVGVKVYLYGKTTSFGRDGDVDNYLKTALDGLNGIAYEDDREIESVWAEKLRAESKEMERMEIYLDEDKNGK